MGKIFKIAIAVMALFVVIVVAGGIYLYSNANSIVKNTIESQLSSTLKVDVSLGRVEMNMGEGEITLYDLEIDNPSGYESDHAMKFGKIFVRADIQSFRSDLPVINEIKLTDSDIIGEINTHGLNLRQLYLNAQSGSKTQADAVSPKYKIEKIVVEKNTVSVNVPVVDNQKVDVSLPTVTLNNVGGSDGATASEVTTAFLGALISKIDFTGLSDVPGEIKGVLEDTQGQLEEIGKDVGDELKGIGRDILGTNGDKK